MVRGRFAFYLLLLFTLALADTGCKKTAGLTVNTSTAALKSTAPFPMGSAVISTDIQGNAYYSGTLLTQYSSMTADYEMKFNIVEPEQGIFNYTLGDYITGFAAQHHIRMHGHNLIWFSALPDWVTTFQGDSLAWENLFKTHIQSEATHYKGQVASWDVVNEALRDDNGSLRNLDITPGDGTGSIWRQHLGPDYVARAFIYAHEADPNALLFYNDYGQEYNTLKLDSMVAMINSLKSRGIPISGVGIQLHTTIYTDTAGISAGLKALAATGLLVHISELDIQVNTSNLPNLVYTTALQQQQAAMYQFVAESYRANVPPAQRYGITTWEFCDADSWIVTYLDRRDWPLPFDSLYHKKPAYFGLMKGLTN